MGRRKFTSKFKTKVVLEALIVVQPSKVTERKVAKINETMNVDNVHVSQYDRKD